MPRPVDGVWWPRSHDPPTELPHPFAGLPRAWGHLVSAR
ncbi:DUF5994 family protein [Streptomyces sp. NPDC059866]